MNATRIGATATMALVIATIQGLPAFSQTAFAEQPIVRHAYQTAQYSEPFRKRCAQLAMNYLDSRKHSIDSNRTLDLLRTIDASRRSSSLKQVGTRRAYQT